MLSRIAVAIEVLLGSDGFSKIGRSLAEDL